MDLIGAQQHGRDKTRFAGARLRSDPPARPQTLSIIQRASREPAVGYLPDLTRRRRRELSNRKFERPRGGGSISMRFDRVSKGEARGLVVVS